MFKLFLIIGAVNAAIAVILGAFGAHGLEGKLSARMMEVYQTGVQYHFYHALGLIVIAFLADKLPNSASVPWAGWVMLIGIILFSGSLYVLSTTGMTKLGMITPLGGMAFIISWILIIVAAVKA
jgi:uncharacterized membrane protein YgdD (TMEM256/DUF423 family)